MKIKYLSILLILLFFACSRPNNKATLPQKGLLWEISGNGLQTPSYLFGTLHTITALQILDSIQKFDSIFKLTSQLICESIFDNTMDSKQQQEYEFTILESFLKPWPNEDSTYATLMSKKQREILDSVIDTDKSLRVITGWNIRPLTATVILKTVFQKNDLNIKLSSELPNNDSMKNVILDYYLQKKAKSYSMNIIALDSKEALQKINDSIFNLISKFNYKSEIEFLTYYIQNHQKIDSLSTEYRENMLSTYLNQEISKIEKEKLTDIRMTLPHIGTKKNRAVLKNMVIDGRNSLWMCDIPELIATKSSFIAVGSSHLGGEKGLINQLRKLNYTVTLIK